MISASFKGSLPAAGYMPPKGGQSSIKPKAGQRAFKVSGGPVVLANFPAEVYKVLGKVKLKALEVVPRGAVNLEALL